MATLEDAEQLRSIWNPENLGQYEKQWIAFKEGTVIDSSTELETLSSRFAQGIQNNNGPLFAFVTFEATV